MEDSIVLTDILRNKILTSGKITFSDFMTTVLYHPAYGYYFSKKIKIGKRGDYYTSSSVHPIFGELICKQLEEMWRITGGKEFAIVEMGAGDGTLCHDILKCAKRECPAFYEFLRYLIVEENTSMKEVQRKRLHENGLVNNQVLWSDYSDPLFNKGVTGCFLSNELVDAFPVHIVEKRGGELKEVYVDFHEDTFTEVVDSPTLPEIGRYFDRLGIALEEGQRAEVNLKAIEWMRWVARSLKKGFVITIDYGYPAEELYAPYRRDGTLLCYYKHKVVKDPFIDLGEQDMTAHVNFTALMMTGEEEGLKTAGMTDQMHFLFGLGIGERIEAIGLNRPAGSEALQERLTIKNLIMPGRMGNIFKVLIQYKGLAEIPELSGLKKDPFIS